MATTCLSLSAMVAAVNWAINPFEVFDPPAIAGLDGHKPAMFTRLRLAKAYLVTRLQPATIILGSSRAETGISPSHPGWKHAPIYNLGLSDSKLAEMALYFEHACAVAPLKEAVLLLDYGTSDAPYTFVPGFDARRLAIVGPPVQTGGWWKDRYDALFTWDALQQSYATWRGLAAEHVYLKDGSRDNAEEWQRVRSKGGLETAFVAFETKAKAVKQREPIRRDWTPLRRILSLAATHKVKLSVVITPFHIRLWQIKLEQDGIQSILSWHRELVDVCAEEATKFGIAPCPIWDFSDSKLIKLSLPELAKEASGGVPLYFESSHFSKRLGDLILDEILTDGNGHPNFKGVLWSKGQVEESLNLLTTRLHQWQDETAP